MNSNTFAAGAVGILIGAIFMGYLASYSVNNNQLSMMQMMGIRGVTNRGITQDPRGSVNDIDRHFIEQMIPHHQGAIDMAKLAQKNAFHQEIKDMADDIISAQTNEINMMKNWQSSWGY